MKCPNCNNELIDDFCMNKRCWRNVTKIKKHIVSFSGGRTSAYLVNLMEQKRKTENWDVEYVFMDTSAEHPKTYKFIKDVVKHYNINLTCLQADFNQPVGEGHTYKIINVNDLKHDPVNGVYGQMMKKYGVPTIMSAWCTSRMKEETHDKYCNDKYGKGNYITWLGMRADEPKRIKLPNNRNIKYLAQLSDYEKSDVLDFWQKMPFDLEIDEHLGNCVFCFKKMNAKVALAARDEPELLNQWIQATQSASDRLNKPIQKLDLFGEYVQEIPKGTMYRNHLTINGVIASFKMFSDEDLKTHVYRNLKDSGTCSESCEAYGNIDMFKEAV
jgi:hypothetical protein